MAETNEKDIVFLVLALLVSSVIKLDGRNHRNITFFEQRMKSRCFALIR
nr:hypothetical protein [Steroidobacter denitrificans]